MDDDTGNESFLTRWSRRKRAGTGARLGEDADRDSADRNAGDGAAGPGRGGPPDAQAEGAQADDQARADDAGERDDDRFADVDYDKLDYGSDYTQFMGDDVPEHVRNRALARLWTSDPILANVDGLTDYSDDFTDAATVPVGALKTAYRVGRGFLSDEEVAEWERLGRPEPEDAATDADAVAGKTGGGPGANAPVPVALNTESPDQDAVRELLAAAAAYSASLYPAESNHGLTAEGLVGQGAILVVARTGDGVAVGCGAVICDLSGAAEIKSMWVDPELRGGGVGAQILEALLDAAERKGATVARLETGPKQVAAVGLYRRFGFQDRGPFGAYADDPNSLFMERSLPRD